MLAKAASSYPNAACAMPRLTCAAAQCGASPIAACNAPTAKSARPVAIRDAPRFTWNSRQGAWRMPSS